MEQPASEMLSPAALKEVLQSAGASHDLDIDLLASVVHAESSSHVHARSRAGAEGLMQLMPGTAAELGVHDAFAPSENVDGGTAYLDALLHRYHDNLAFALAAYNAGPAAVDRWHGVPPYRETRAYVARIIHEFNQRYAARQAAVSLASITASRVTRP
jgi:soluble lytic murein transglycosylase-like protein